MNGVTRTAAGALALPAQWMVGGLRRATTGPAAVLECVVSSTAELIDRQRLLDRLSAVCTDEAVVGVLFRFDGPLGGWAANTDLRAVIERLVHSGKGTWAQLENPGNAELWLASACEHVYMVPTGQIMAAGVGAELTFFGEALQRLGLVPDIEAAGAFKAAGEPFLRAFPSSENRAATKALVDGLHARLVTGIAEARGLSPAAVDDAIAHAPLSAAEAVNRGLVDELAYPDQLSDVLDATYGSRCRRLALGRWARLSDVERRLGHISSAEHIAILHLQGPILLDERSGNVAIAARVVVPMLQRIRESRSIRGVVLHVNSPGGSAFASDLIWREVERLVREKPVVACFEDVAASGGYYLAAPATQIVARPGTITGSIGVVGGKLVARDAMRTLGIHTESIAAAPNATMYSASQPFTDAQRVRFRASLQHIYDGFVDRVASGRRRHVDLVEPFCRGRVWLGADAHDVGLVDHLGNVDTAVALVEKLASVDATRVHLSGHPRPSFLSRQVQRVVREALPIGVRAIAGPSLTALGPAATAWLALPGEPLALWPFDPVIR